MILDALNENHLCNYCEYDENIEVVKGTECDIQKLINKFERVKSGSASNAGWKGGISSNVKRLEKESDYQGQIAELRGGLSYFTEKRNQKKGNVSK